MVWRGAATDRRGGGGVVDAWRRQRDGSVADAWWREVLLS